MTQLLSSHRDKLQQLIDALLEHESLDREQINQLLGDPLTELKISEPSGA